jgi:photosystem II stability/assembly factor-like uncharacterized protein
MIAAADGSLLMGTEVSGVYRSTNGGTTWVQRNSGLLDMNVWSLALEPDGHILACTYLKPNEGVPYSPMKVSPIGRLFRSTDLGRSWVLVDTTTASARLLVNSHGYIWRDTYADNFSGLSRSTNGGTLWTSQGLAGGDYIGSAAMDSSDNLYVGATYIAIGATKGIYRSTNSGVNWTSITSSIGPRALAFKTGGYLFAGTPTAVARITTTGTGFIVLDSTWGATSFAISSAGNVYATGSDGSVRRSTNNGTTWSTVLSSTAGAKRIFCPSGTDLFINTSLMTLRRSTNSGDRWSPASDGVQIALVPSLYCSAGNVLYAGTTSSLWRTSDKGGAWSAPFSAGVRIEDYIMENSSMYPPYFVWALSGGKGSFIAAVQEWHWYQSVTAGFESSTGHVMTTTTDWSSKVDQRTELSGYQQPGAILPYAATVGSDNAVYLGGKTGIGKLTGSTFSKVSGPLDGKSVFALTRNVDDTLFSGTLNFGVFRSGTHAATWAIAAGGMGDLDVYALATDSSGRVFAGTGTGLYISKNNGSTWAVAPEFPSTRVQAIATNTSGHVYVATTDYVWVSESHGSAPWFRLNAGLPTADISSLSIGPDGDVYAGTWGYGVYRRGAWLETPAAPGLVYPANLQANVPSNVIIRWRKVAGAATYHLQLSTGSTFISNVVNDSTLTDTTFAANLPAADTYYWRVCAKNETGAGAYASPWKFASSLTGVDKDPNLPDEYFLAQNHPNPFNPSTQIQYGLPVRSMVRIAVYNTLGQQVAVLKGEEQEAGYHEVTFDARTMASGVYLCRMEAGSFVQVRKLVLVR